MKAASRVRVLVMWYKDVSFALWTKCSEIESSSRGVEDVGLFRLLRVLIGPSASTGALATVSSRLCRYELQACWG